MEIEQQIEVVKELVFCIEYVESKSIINLTEQTERGKELLDYLTNKQIEDNFTAFDESLNK
mgnify:CR=1 FL=1